MLEKMTLQLDYQPPFDWTSLLNFLSYHLLKGVDSIEDHCYLRTVQIDQTKGWIKVSHLAQAHQLSVDLSLSLIPVLPILLMKLHHLFDLDAPCEVISAHLKLDPLLTAAVLKNPGLRVPGSFDAFECALRTIIGQQISGKAATTLIGRVVDAFGEKIDTPFAFLYALCPTAKQMACQQVTDLALLGIIIKRAYSIIELAKEVVSGQLKLEPTSKPEGVIKQLTALPGIGPWTAHYIAMRALHWSDAFPKEDSALRKRLGMITFKEIEKLAFNWRPWRSYALLHLWQL